MTTRLAEIIAEKHLEVAALYQLIEQKTQHPLAQLLKAPQQKIRTANFKQALRQHELAVIAEIKRRSPSKGELATIANPVHLAQQYVAGGAQALSILTDEKFFGGHLRDLQQVADVVATIPLLRKDFIIDEIQIAEAALAGADAVLAIVAVLGERTAAIINSAKKFGLDVIVEIHAPQELEIAVAAKAEIIGINNRDLKTFEIDLDRSLQLVADIPDEIIKVAESGITTPEIAVQYRQAGFDAVLIGESLVKATRPGDFIGKCRDVTSF